ncbi:arginine--tRNA ligase [soil metagenome]
MAEPLLPLLGQRVRSGLRAAFGEEVDTPEPLVLPARDARHGDYSTSAPLALARQLREAAPVLARRLADALEVDDICLPPEVAGGFVNLRLRPEWLASRLEDSLSDERPLAVEPAVEPQKVVVDYSAPNVAKEMHVGHLRTTIIGDSLAHVYELLGHEVERVNHVGDWGTQFGILIAHLEEVRPSGGERAGLAGGGLDLGALLGLYQEANERFRTDEGFRDRARQRVVDLQSGEPTARAMWASMVELSRNENAAVYELLGVRGLIERGESSYAPLLPQVAADLEAAGLVVVDDGAKCVYVDGFTNKDGDPLPLIVQKADGGYNYATTDLAAIRARVASGATLLLYVVGAEQSQHLEMVFAVARRVGWLPPNVTARHVPYGLIQGESGKRLRTRTGGSVRLVDLLTEAIDRARAFVVARAEERDEPVPEDVDEVARIIGIGAVKYTDLSTARMSGYVFSFDRMLSLRGNTPPYLQYAHARLRSILREGGDGERTLGAVALVEDDEVALAKRLVGFGDVIDRVVADDAPNHLCAALFELASAFNGFYERCPVLRAEPGVRASRLALCEATARTLRGGLGLLGIEAPERL